MKQYQYEITNLDAQIQIWYQDYVVITTSPVFVKKEKELREYLEGSTVGIINAKEGQFLSDKAHENGYAYKLNQTAYSRPMNRPPTFVAPKLNNDVLTYPLLPPYHLANRQSIMIYHRIESQRNVRENPTLLQLNHFNALSGPLRLDNHNLFILNNPYHDY